MKRKFIYKYSNGYVTIHNNFIKDSTMKKEANGASSKVEIYKITNEYQFDWLLEDLENRIAGEYITTKALN